MHTRTLALIFAATALAAGACGGSSTKSSSSSTAAASGGGSSSNPLAGLKTSSTGPSKLDATITIAVDGKPTDATLSALLSKPISIKVSGVSDAAAKKYDLRFIVKLGAANIDAKLRSDGTKQWLGIGDSWYDAGALTQSAGGSTSSFDPSKIQSSLGNPASYFKSVKVVGDESVDGNDAQHVTGDVDLAKLLAGVNKASSSLKGNPVTSTLPVGQLEKAVKSATVDLWISKKDHSVLRTKLAVAADMGGQQGIKGITFNVDATNLPTSAVSISAPSSIKPAADLQQALLGMLAPLMGSAGGISTTS